MTVADQKKRQKRTSPSNPKLAAEGWEDLEPTTLIDRAREKIREATRELSAPPSVAPKGA
jgi:hypothetical protein